MRKRGHNSIGWCHKTENPITGCEHGCPYCYVKRLCARFPDKMSMKPTFHPARLEKMRKELATTEPSRVFVGSCADMFGDWIKDGADVTPDHVRQVLEVCGELEQHRFLFLTKNPVGYRQYEFPENCWCGTSLTNRDEDQDAGRPLQLHVFAPRERQFVSWEPAIGSAGTNLLSVPWLIIGGLTGRDARPAKRDSVRWVLENRRELPTYIKDNAGCFETVKQYPEGLRVE